MRVGKTYYVCFKIEEEAQYVTPNGYLSSFLESALRFNSEEEALVAINTSYDDEEDDEFSYMKSDFNVYDKCSVGEITTMLTEVNRTDYTIEELDFSVRTYNALKRRGINSLASILALTHEELLNIRNVNVRSLREITDKLDEMKLTLRENWLQSEGVRYWR